MANVLIYHSVTRAEKQMLRKVDTKLNQKDFNNFKECRW